MLAYDFPLLGAFLAMFWFFVWVVWIILLFRTVVDIFRSHDLSGVAKALWLVLVILLPYLGVFAYVIARGQKMGARELEHARARERDFQAYVREAAGDGGGPSGELARLADLRDRGVLTEDEFQQQKSRVLAAH